MKYKKYYKKGLGHFVNKELMKLSKPTKETKLFYFLVITFLIILGFLLK